MFLKTVKGQLLCHVGLLIYWLWLIEISLIKAKLIGISSESIEYMREEWASPLNDLLMTLISHVGDRYVVSFFMVLGIWYLKPQRALIVMSAFQSACLIHLAIKLYNQDGRPFFINGKIKVFQPCKDLEYGYPSGHTSCCIAYYFTLMKLFFEEHGHHFPRWLPRVAKLLLAILISLVTFSRAFLGVHSFD